jgi:hypothetical protein
MGKAMGFLGDFRGLSAGGGPKQYDGMGRNVSWLKRSIHHQYVNHLNGWLILSNLISCPVVGEFYLNHGWKIMMAMISCSILFLLNNTQVMMKFIGSLGVYTKILIMENRDLFNNYCISGYRTKPNFSNMISGGEDLSHSMGIYVLMVYLG